MMTTVPKRYRNEIEEGVKYELVWPGSEMPLWDLGDCEGACWDGAQC